MSSGGVGETGGGLISMGAVASAVAYPLMANYVCEGEGPCGRSENMGWRYFVFT